MKKVADILCTDTVYCNSQNWLHIDAEKIVASGLEVSWEHFTYVLNPIGPALQKLLIVFKRVQNSGKGVDANSASSARARSSLYSSHSIHEMHQLRVFRLTKWANLAKRWREKEKTFDQERSRLAYAKIGTSLIRIT